MTFMRGSCFELRVLDWEDPDQVDRFTKYVNAGLTTQHLFTGSIPMRTADYAQRWEDEAKQDSIQFGIWADNVMVGTTGLHSFRPMYRSWEFRILIFDPEYVEKGIGTEVTTLVTDYAFTRLNAHKVWLGVNAENVRAVKCYSRVGFTLEGQQRDEIFCFGHYADILHMGVLESEWKARKVGHEA